MKYDGLSLCWRTEMRKVIVYEWMTLDGVAQAPPPDEDSSGG